MNYKKKFVGKERVTKNTCITEPYETQKRVAPKTYGWVGREKRRIVTVKRGRVEHRP